MVVSTMKLLIFVLFFCLPGTAPEWLLDFNKAQEQASASNKIILLNFSGSDWCGPCIKLKREILTSDAFNKYAAENLVLVNADFPRMKKNALTDEQTKKNEQL